MTWVNLTPAELVILATELKAVGVKSFALDGVAVEFFESPEQYEIIDDAKNRDTMPPEHELTATDRAAMALMNRGR